VERVVVRGLLLGNKSSEGESMDACDDTYRRGDRHPLKEHEVVLYRLVYKTVLGHLPPPK